MQEHSCIKYVTGCVYLFCKVAKEPQPLGTLILLARSSALYLYDRKIRKNPNPFPIWKIGFGLYWLGAGNRTWIARLLLKLWKKVHFQSIWYNFIIVIYIVVYPNRMVCNYGLGKRQKRLTFIRKISPWSRSFPSKWQKTVFTTQCMETITSQILLRALFFLYHIMPPLFWYRWKSAQRFFHPK